MRGQQARGKVYARRLGGDLDLGLEPRRIKQIRAATYAKDWARIMTPGGLLPGGVWQDIYTQSETQNFRIGARMVVDDRVFHYSYAQEALIKMMGGYNHNQFPINAALTIQATAGNYWISVPELTCAADDYAGGWIVMFTAPLQMRRILGNDASDGAEAILYLDGPWEGTGVIGTWVTGYPSIYGNVRCPPAPDPDYISFVVVPWIMVDNAHWFWGQTWGPCYGVAGHTVPGATPNNRWVAFSTAGNIISNADANIGAGQQLAGYLLPRTSLGAGDQLYMLQLQP